MRKINEFVHNCSYADYIIPQIGQFEHYGNILLNKDISIKELPFKGRIVPHIEFVEQLGRYIYLSNGKTKYIDGKAEFLKISGGKDPHSLIIGDKEIPVIFYDNFELYLLFRFSVYKNLEILDAFEKYPELKRFLPRISISETEIEIK